jgi:hypothetical protein
MGKDCCIVHADDGYYRCPICGNTLKGKEVENAKG